MLILAGDSEIGKRRPTRRVGIGSDDEELRTALRAISRSYPSRSEDGARILTSRLSLPAAVAALTFIAVGCFYVSRLLFLGLLYGIPVVTIAFMTIAIPRFWRIKNRVERKQTRWAFQLHTIRSVLVALAAIALTLMMLDSAEGSFIFLFAAAVPYLFFGVPAVGALIGNLLTGQPDARLFQKDRLIWVSRLLTSFSWVTSAAVIALAVAVFQPWPLSLREGPDTEWSRSGFEATFGFVAPGSVTELYYRKFSFRRSEEVYVKFRFREPAVVDEIMESLRLEESGRPQTYAVIRDHFRDRWFTENRPAAEKLTECYESHRAPEADQFVWIDRPANLFYYMAVDFTAQRKSNDETKPILDN